MDKYLKARKEQKALNRKNYKGPFCCWDMDVMIEDNDTLYNVKYNSKLREYYLESLEGPYMRILEYCPWCGIHLKLGLRDEWFDILEHEYGLDLPDIPDQEKKIPAEFKTDEWWKKRGL